MSYAPTPTSAVSRDNILHRNLSNSEDPDDAFKALNMENINFEKQMVGCMSIASMVVCGNPFA